MPRPCCPCEPVPCAAAPAPFVPELPPTAEPARAGLSPPPDRRAPPSLPEIPNPRPPAIAPPPRSPPSPAPGTPLRIPAPTEPAPAPALVSAKPPRLPSTPSGPKPEPAIPLAPPPKPGPLLAAPANPNEGFAPPLTAVALGILSPAVWVFVSAKLGRVSYMRNQTRIAASTTPARYVTA